jgi:hypothetical protein
MTEFIEIVHNKAGERGLQFNFHPGQHEAWNATEQVVLVLAGSQGGKTSFGSPWLHREIEQTRGAKDNDYIASSANYDLLSLKMLPEMQRYFCEGLGWEYRAASRTIETPNRDVRIILRSAESRAGLESSTAKAAWLDEWGMDDVDVTAWEAVNRRLTLNQGRILITTTAYNLGWLKLLVYDKAMGGDSRYKVISFRSIDNPAFPRAEYERLKRDLPDWKFAMFHEGQFSRPAGMVYSNYVDSYREHGGHLVKPFETPKAWLRHVGVDFGGVNLARLWVAEDPATKEYFIYRERLGDQSGAKAYVDDTLSYREPIHLVAGGTRSEDDFRKEWGAFGLGVAEPLIWEVEAGIDHVHTLFMQNRLFVVDTCVGVRSELRSYSRELDDLGEPTRKIADKQKFHRLDCLRYIGSFFSCEPPQRVEQPKQYEGRNLGSLDKYLVQQVDETEEY